MNSKFQVAVAQITSNDRIQDNLAQVQAAVTAAAAQKARLVVFPENTLFFRIRSGQAMQALELRGAEATALTELAKSKDIHILLTTAAKDDRGHVLNATVYFSPSAPARIVYAKVHLFDVEVTGAPPVRESEHFAAGKTPEVLTIDGWSFGLSICYDLRFAELYGNYSQKVDAILIPSAFLVPTGKAHWHVLLQARAIESQAYVLAPAQFGDHISEDGSVRQTFGHSLAVDPWGRILLDLEEGLGVKVVELQRESIQWVRRQIPMASHRRLK